MVWVRCVDFATGRLDFEGRGHGGQEPGRVRQLLVLLHHGCHGGGALHQDRQPRPVQRAGLYSPITTFLKSNASKT